MHTELRPHLWHKYSTPAGYSGASLWHHQAAPGQYAYVIKGFAKSKRGDEPDHVLLQLYAYQNILGFEKMLQGIQNWQPDYSKAVCGLRTAFAKLFYRQNTALIFLQQLRPSFLKAA